MGALSCTTDKQKHTEHTKHAKSGKHQSYGACHGHDLGSWYAGPGSPLDTSDLSVEGKFRGTSKFKMFCESDFFIYYTILIYYKYTIIYYNGPADRRIADEHPTCT